MENEGKRVPGARNAVEEPRNVESPASDDRPVPELSFKIEAKDASHGAWLFVAEKDGLRVATERYKPGDTSARTKAAKRWSEHPELRNGSGPSPELIARHLEKAEVELVEQQDQRKESLHHQETEEVVCFMSPGADCGVGLEHRTGRC